jgi:hypothetical protein
MKSLRFAALAIALLTSAPILAAGAIAVDTEHGQKAGDEGYGIGWGKTRDAAARDALKQCSSAGNTNCKVLARFDTCGAYASNRTAYGVGWGATEEDAEAMALEKCGRCKIVLSECE